MLQVIFLGHFPLRWRFFAPSRNKPAKKPPVERATAALLRRRVFFAKKALPASRPVGSGFHGSQLCHARPLGYANGTNNAPANTQPAPFF